MSSTTRTHHLRMDQSQETALIDYLKKRLPQLESDNEDRIKADKCGSLIYENQRKDRAKPGTVFQHENFAIPLTSWVVDHFASKTENELFTRDPIAQFSPEGAEDADSAKGIDRFLGYKLFTQANLTSSLLDAQQSLWTHRALILKAVYDEDSDTWEEFDHVVLHDKTTNTPVEIIDHGFIIQGRDELLTVADPVTGREVVVLAADPTFMVDESKHFWAPAKQGIKMTEIRYAGAKSVEVDSDCFFAPSAAKTLDEADCIQEVYDKPAHWVSRRFYERPWETFDTLKAKAQKDARRKTPGKRREASKETLAFDRENPSYGIREVWLERDVLGWGAPQRIVLWIERSTWTLIDYEFQKKVMPWGRHPYDAITTWKPDGGRFWWGKSLVELMRPFQEYVDLQFNRHSFRNAINANPIVMQNPDAIQEKKTFHELAPFETVTAESTTTRIEEWLQVFTFPKLDLDTQELIEKAIYWCNFWLGISNIAQGDYSDIPQNTTLGGQEATLREASKLSRRWTRRVKNGFESHISKLSEVAIETMDEEEAFSYLNGDASKMGFVQKNAVAAFRLNVKLAVGRDRSTQAIQEQQLAITLVEKYLTYPPQFQVIVRPIYKTCLYLLGFDNADDLLPLPTMPMVVPGSTPPAGGPAVAQAPEAAPEAQSPTPPAEPPAESTQ